MKRKEREDLIIALDRSVMDLNESLARARGSLKEGSNNLKHSDPEEADPQEGPSGTQIPPTGTPPRDFDSSDDDIDRLLSLVILNPEKGQEIINS